MTDEITKIIEKRTQYPDSVELGTPGKSGCVKVYFNASNKKEAEERIISAFEQLKKAQEEAEKLKGLQ